MRRATQTTLETTPRAGNRDDGVRSKSTVLTVDVSLVSDAEIHELNRQYRGKDKPTDVLSFAFEDELPGGVAFPQGDVSPLGDLIISVETAARQAHERGHELEEELAFLAVHGALHLLGFDHDDASSRRRMWAEQTRVMALLKPSIS